MNNYSSIFTFCKHDVLISTMTDNHNSHDQPELPSVPGATMYGNPVQRARFGGRQVTHGGSFYPEQAVHEVIADPELIVRFDGGTSLNNTPEAIAAHQAKLRETFAKNIQALRVLHNQFGISIPNYVVSFEDPRIANPQASKEYQYRMRDVMTGMSRVHGVQFFSEHIDGYEHGVSQLNQIPERVTVATMDKLLNYYEAVIAGKVPRYLADQRLGNMVYGRLKDDYRDDVYIIDAEQERYIFDAVEDGMNPAFDTIVRYGEDLADMSAAYGKAYPALARRILELSRDAPHETSLGVIRNCSGKTELLSQRSRVQYYLAQCEQGKVPTSVDLRQGRHHA